MKRVNVAEEPLFGRPAAGGLSVPGARAHVPDRSHAAKGLADSAYGQERLGHAGEVRRGDRTDLCRSQGLAEETDGPEGLTGASAPRSAASIMAPACAPPAPSRRRSTLSKISNGTAYIICPIVHITAPPRCRSSSGVSPHRRGACAYWR